jgi:hypothetical protein
LQHARRIRQQIVLITRDILDADALNVIDSRTKADRIGDIARAGFETIRRRLDTRRSENSVPLWSRR